jgi:hypothetical protein
MIALNPAINAVCAMSFLPEWQRWHPLAAGD